QDLLYGMYFDLQFKTVDDFETLYTYCYQVAGVVGLFSTHVFGYSDEDTLQFANYLGISLQLINIVRDFGEDLKRGRIYIPSELLSAHQLSPGLLYQGQFEKNQIVPALQDLADKSRFFYKKAIECLPEYDRLQQKPGLVMAGIYHELLDVIEASN